MFVFLPAVMVIRPLSTAEQLPTSPPAAVSGLQLVVREKEACLQPPTVGNKQHSVIGVTSFMVPSKLLDKSRME